MKIRAMIAEDEQMARKELEYLLQDEKDVIITPHAETGEQTIELYLAHRPDVIFLDVEMPGLSGIEASRRIIKEAGVQAPLFVFTTAYDEYAIDAFDIEAVDYLLKPYEEKRFRKTMERIRKNIDKKKKLDLQKMAKLFIDDGERYVIVAPEEIYFAVPDKNRRFIEIHTDKQIIKSRMTLKELEEKLQGYPFFRPHRSYLVNLHHVLEITPWFNGTSNLTLNDKQRTKIPVSRSASKKLHELFNN